MTDDFSLVTETLIAVGNDHRLADKEPLEKMLNACEKLALTASKQKHL
ncbi:hypothetical protein [Stieleria bergensis]